MRKNDDGLGLLGLARRAGKLVVGAEESRRAIRRGVVRVVVLADDASDGQRAKVVALAEAMGIPMVAAADRARLGKSVGAGLVTAVAVTDRGFGAKLLAEAGVEVSGNDVSGNKGPKGHERLKGHKG